MMLSNIEVRGRKFAVHVESGGEFFADFDGTRITADSLAELVRKLTRATKSIKVAVRFATLRSDGTMRDRGALLIGTCTGRHAAREHAYFVRWENLAGEPIGKPEQVNGWELERRCIDPEFAEEYAGLCALVDEAIGRRTAFEERHKINVRAAVDALVENEHRAEANGGAA